RGGGKRGAGPTPEEGHGGPRKGRAPCHRIPGGSLVRWALPLSSPGTEAVPPKGAGTAGPGPGPRGPGPPRPGLEFLLELERRGQCDEAHLGPLMQLLRVLSRQDLLPRLSLKRARPGRQGPARPGLPPSPSSVTPGALLDPVVPLMGPEVPWEGKAGGRGLRAEERASGEGSASPASPRPSPCFPADIRLRVRAEYCEHGAALAQGVVSRRPQSVARQLDLFGQAMAVLKSRDLGSVVCDIKFSELSYLDAFWGDYLSGALLQALRGVFLTEALREAVGREPIRLLVSVDEGDYEAGRRRLLLLGGSTAALPQTLI
uniref:Death effector domain containing 2 n=1 Tax=Sarcophilus harrisii TaxID=9305 RepID=G3VH38_SARHA